MSLPANFPTSLDSLANPGPTTNRDDAGFELDLVISRIHDILEALEAKAGIGATTPDAIFKSLLASAAGTSSWDYHLAPLGSVSPSGVATFSFSSINQNFKHLLVVGSGRVAGSAGSGIVNLLMRMNVDTAANYAYQQHYAIGASPASASQTAQTSAQIGNVNDAGGTSPTAAFAPTMIWLPNYTTSGPKKAGLSLTFVHYATSTVYVSLFGFEWAGTVAVTSLDFLNSAAQNFDSGSRYALYGLG